MEEQQLTPEEEASLELNRPAYEKRGQIKEKIKLQHKFRGHKLEFKDNDKDVKRLAYSGINEATGGTYSKLNPIDKKDREFREITKALEPEDIEKPNEQ